MGIQTRILIVEDNSDDEKLLMRQLRGAKLDQFVKVIADGKLAVEYLTNSDSLSHGLVALFLDLNLPSLSGLEVLESIRSHAHIRDLPVIVMTSSNLPTDLARCQNLGVSSYLQKPVTLADFIRAVANRFHALPSQAISESRSALSECTPSLAEGRNPL